MALLNGSPAATTLNLATTSINPVSNVAEKVAEGAINAAASPVGLAAVGIIGGVALAAVGIKFTYNKVKAYEEKKHLKEIEIINQLYETYLKRIPIPNRNEVSVAFPPIFQFKTDEKKSVNVEFMHYTDEQIRKAGKNTPSNTNTALIPYQEKIKMALLKLKEYYLVRDKKYHEDITSAVIVWLINMLETHILNFEGYDYDIAYIDAINKFINAFASLSQDKKSEHVTHLTNVYVLLNEARNSLIEHNEKLSLEEMMGELRTACHKKSEAMQKHFIKLTTPEKHWPHVETATLDEISKGLLLGKYTHQGLFNLDINDSAVKLQDSFIKKWIMQLANYHNKSLNDKAELSKTDVLPPSQSFLYPSLARYNELKANKKRSEAEDRELKTIENDFEKLEELFKNCDNFFTREKDPKTKEGELVKLTPIKSKEKLIERVKALAEFAELIHELISLQYLCLHIINSIKQLGQIDAKNPTHYRRIFNILTSLSNEIVAKCKQNRERYEKIKESNGNIMLLIQQQTVFVELQEELESTKTTINLLAMRIKDYREHTLKNNDKDEPTKATVRHEMFEVANLLTQLYDLKLGNRSLKVQPQAKDEIKDKKEKKEKREKKEKKEHHHHHKDKSRSNSSASLIAVTPTLPAAAPSSAPILKQPMETSLQPASNENDPNTLKTKIQLSLQEITRRITEIATKETLLENELADYRLIADDLTDMRLKANALIDEQHKTPEREDKANKTIELTLRLCKLTQDFLAFNHQDRMSNAEQFAMNVHALLEIPKTPFIDKHNSETKQSINNLFGHSLFMTDTRSRTTRLEEACDRIAILLCERANEKKAVV